MTDKPITTIINTHTHGDHTGSNDFFGASVDTIVHENTRTNMARMDAFRAQARFVPKRTYKDKLSLCSGRIRSTLHYLGVGHTNGDTFVVFPALRVMHTGVMSRGKRSPSIEMSNGGSVVAHAETLGKAVSSIKNVVPSPPADTSVGRGATRGNTPISTAISSRGLRNRSKAGKSVGQAATAYRVPAKYKGYTVSPNPQFGDAKANVEIVYKELKK